MMDKDQRLEDHHKFRELAALAQAGALTEREHLALKEHLECCPACHEVYREYSLVHSEGMPYLAAEIGQSMEARAWDSRSVRNGLLEQIREADRKKPGLVEMDRRRWLAAIALPKREAVIHWATAALAACLILAVATGAYRLGGRTPAAVQMNASTEPMEGTPQRLAPIVSAASKQDAPSDEPRALLASQTLQISRLQQQMADERNDIVGLHSLLRAAQERSAALMSASGKQEELSHQLSEERDQLAGQLHEAEKSYELLRAELTNLRADHDRTLLHTASLESRIEELSALAREQDRKLKDSEQYLSSDRDIRELMGARKLYIADVFDVDSSSHTRKSFGRVFYTQNKSLIFYAFDLDHEPGIKSASAFQVWGQRDAEASEKPRPMNLGILYMDSESNRRWVLRLDDPKQLAEIDAVFVTVEPHGGSQRPTGKPFLYALLRKEANHP